jgi:hypothetical protein
MKLENIKFFPGSAPTRAVARLTTALITCGALGLLAGCATQPESHIVSTSPPPAPVRSVTTTTTVTTPDTMPAPVVSVPAGVLVASATPAVNTTIVTVAPPAPESEVMLTQPGPNYVWLAGYWTYRNDNYEWMAGHWQLPPSASAVWVAPRWEQQGNAYKFTEGYWN